MIKIILLILLITIIKLINCIEVEGNSNDKQLLLLDNKYREKEPIGLENILFANNEDVINRGLGKLKDQGSICKGGNKVELDIVWESQLASTISNTPLIVDLFGTGDKQIIYTNSHTYIDVINGIDGDRLINGGGGWPYILPYSSFSTSPLVYDIDGNGDLDIMVATTDAEILFIDSKKAVAIKEKTLKVPPLKVKKLWYDGLDDKHVDASFSLYNKDNQKYQIQKQIKDNQEFEEIQKKEYQINGGNDNSKFQILKQISLDIENDPLYSVLYDKYLQDNKWFSRKTSEYIWVDSHILSTPVIADIDGDGINELVVSVSYYYDPEKYENPHYKSQLDDGVQVENYVAGGISVFNLATGEIKWQTHLDLTTDKTDFKGLVYGSPTVVDLNNDGKLEIIIGTALGFLYVLDYQGVPLTGNYPLVLESIFTQIVTEDLDSDGRLELIVIDTKGNVVCFNSDGDEIWSQQVTGKTEFPPSIGDLDGDGILDVVMSTFTTGIFAWNGKTGKPLQGYPLKFEPSIISPLLLLETNDNNGGLTIFVHANDGILYSINDNGKCIGRLDIGDFSITKILTNDLTADGNLNLLLSTFDQKVYCLSITSGGGNVKFNPLKVENSYNINGNKFSSYSKSTPMGVLITQPTTTTTSGSGGIDLHYNFQYSRNSIDISGSDFNLEILILDQKNISLSTIEIKKKYTISVYFGEIRLKKEIYYSTGLKQLLITIPPSVSRSDVKLLIVKLENINSQIYQDSIPISFNFYFYRFLKFLIILPILISTILLLIYQSNNSKSKNIKKNSLL